MDVPIGKLKRNLENQSSSRDKKIVVLVATGAFAPIHFGHLTMFDVARKELERLGYYIVAGYHIISLSILLFAYVFLQSIDFCRRQMKSTCERN